MEHVFERMELTIGLFLCSPCGFLVFFVPYLGNNLHYACQFFSHSKSDSFILILLFPVQWLHYSCATFLLGKMTRHILVQYLTVRHVFFTANFSDNSGATRKMGGFFKERLRELGGLDTICDLAAGCLRNIRV